MRCSKCKVEYDEDEIICSNCFELRREILPKDREKRMNIISEYLRTKEEKNIKLIRRLERVFGYLFFLFFIILGYLRMEWTNPRVSTLTSNSGYRGIGTSIEIVFIFTNLACVILSGIDTEIIKDKSKSISIIQIISIPLVFIIGETYTREYIYNLSDRILIEGKSLLFTNIYMLLYYISYCATVIAYILRKRRYIITQEFSEVLRLLLNKTSES